jgi:hypothetical protein
MNLKNIACTGLVILSLPSLAVADEFAPGSEITQTSLNAIISNATVQFDSGALIANNTSISDESFSGAVGIIAVAQNSGANSTIQQSVSFKADSLALSQ